MAEAAKKRGSRRVRAIARFIWGIRKPSLCDFASSLVIRM